MMSRGLLLFIFISKEQIDTKDIYLHGSIDGPLSHQEANMVVLIQ